MIKIGLTGGIGSGKSLARSIFEKLGVPTYDADFEAKELINREKSVISKIKETFGNNIYLENGTIDKKQLSSLIFQDKSKLKAINSIVHPAVKSHFESWCLLNSSAPYIIKEAAILFESGAYKEMDKIVTVVAPEELRIKRVMSRDNASEEQIKNRIKNQMSDEEKIIRSNYVVNNDEESLLLPQIIKIHNLYK